RALYEILAPVVASARGYDFRERVRAVFADASSERHSSATVVVAGRRVELGLEQPLGKARLEAKIYIDDTSYQRFGESAETASELDTALAGLAARLTG